MKLLKHLLTIALLWPSLVLAGPLTDSKSMLEKANIGKNELREVILDLSFNVPEMRDPKTFDSYFFLLADLKELSISTGLETFYPGIVDSLGLTMALQGIRWLDITKVSEEKLIYYVKWMNADALGRFLSLIEFEVSSVKDPVIARKVSSNIALIMPLVEEKTRQVPYVELGFKRLQSDAAVSLLKSGSLTDAEISLWIQKVNLVSSVSEYLDYLNQSIYALNKVNINTAHKYTEQIPQVLAQTQRLNEAAPGWLINSLGESLIETLVRMIKHEEKFNPNEFETSLSAISGRQLQVLSVQLINLEKSPSQAYVNEYLRVANYVINTMIANGLNREADDLRKALGRVSAPIIAQKYNVEGHYQLSNGSKDVWNFTLAHARENALIASLTSSTGVMKTFYHVSYNSDDDTFAASERENDSDMQSNNAIKFRITESGKINLVDPYIRYGNNSFTGKKTQSFPNLWTNAVKGSPSAEGTYSGTIVLPNGMKLNVRLIVTAFNGYTVGRIESSNQLTINLTIGSNGNDGVLIMTSGRPVDGSWFQIRGHLVKGGYNAQVVIGGKGISKTVSFLKKVNINN